MEEKYSPQDILFGTKLSVSDQKNINLSVPTGYTSKVRRIWYYYKKDPLFGYLIDREVDFTIKNLAWEMPWLEDTQSFIDKIKDKIKSKKNKKEDKEREFWINWASLVNYSVPNIISGIEEVFKWVAKSLLLTGIAACEWEKETKTIGRRSYQVPTKIVVHPSTSIRIQKYSNKFLEEDFYVYIPPIYRQPWAWKHDVVQHDHAAWVDKFMYQHKWLETVGQKGKQNAFVLRHNWSPADLADHEIDLEYSGYYDNSSTSPSVSSQHLYFNESNSYPTPSCERLLPSLIIREQLFSSDSSILDGIINLITVFKYGTDEHPAKPGKRDDSGNLVTGKEGDLYHLKKTIDACLVGNAVNLYVDHKTDIDTLERNTESLLSNDKYLQSTIEILQFFGIWGVNWKGRTRYEDTVITNQEERVNSLRNYIYALLNVLIDQIFENNPGIVLRPKPSFMPINIRPFQWWELLKDLRKMGQISNADLLRQIGLNPGAVMSRMARELQSGIKDIQDQSSPIQFTQTTVDKLDNKIIKDNKKDGRPKSEIDKGE